MMTKSHSMKQQLDKIAKTMFGRSRMNSCCVTCGSEKITPKDLNDALSRKEFSISHICQNSMFNEE